jgi:hypothetical protein
MGINYTIFKYSSNFDSISEFVATLPSHRRILELASVLVSVVESHNSFSIHKAMCEGTFVDTIMVVEHSIPVHLSISVLALVFQIATSPVVFSFTVEKTIFEFTRVYISISFTKLALSMNYIGSHLSFVDGVICLLSTARHGLIPGRFKPGKLSKTMHLRINEVSDIMAAICPLELTKALYLRVK